MRRLSTRRSLLDFAVWFRVCKRQLRREVASLIWLLLGPISVFSSVSSAMPRICACLCNCFQCKRNERKSKNKLLGEAPFYSVFASEFCGLFSSLQSTAAACSFFGDLIASRFYLRFRFGVLGTVQISFARRISAQHWLLDFAAFFRLLRRGVVSLIWPLLESVCSARRLRCRQGFTRT